MENVTPQPRSAFTLIELLIVVAIIAILAMIAVPNFLNAQLRSKVSRVQNDARTLATALEAYCVDHDAYPSGNLWGVAGLRPSEPDDVANRRWVLERLSTPVAYVSTAFFGNPFHALRRSDSRINGIDPVDTDFAAWTPTAPPGDPDYHLYTTYLYTSALADPTETTGMTRARLDLPAGDPGLGPARAWIVQSSGPMEAYINLGGVVANADAAYSRELIYDPTNGAVSFGNIFRVGGEALGRGNHFLSAASAQ